jgi:hypothetical protein
MALTKVSYSMITGAPANVLDFGADPTGVANSQPAIQAAINSGAVEIIIPSGTYRLNSGLTISKNNAVKKISGFDMSTTLKLYTATTASIFDIQYIAPPPETKQFFTIENLILDSNGTKADAFLTYGIFSTGTSYAQFNNIRATNFSGSGCEIKGCVYIGINNYTAGECRYGLAFELNLGTACTSVVVDRAYISGCLRGITQTNANNMTYIDCVLEYSGSSTTTDGAFHLAGGMAEIITPYFEINGRNFVSIEGSPVIVQPYGWTSGTAANVVTYNALSFDERGVTLQYPYNLYLPRINADITSNRDLVIGTNLTVPVAGGSVIFGNETMYSQNGFITSGAWTNTYAIPASESTGSAANSKALYEYTCYAGAADLSTGFDAGTIMNGTLRSYSGSNPAWLRLVGGSLASVAITGTAGQFSCTASTLTEGMAVTIAGTFGGTGSITGYTDPKTYYIITTNGTTTFTLSNTYNTGTLSTVAITGTSGQFSCAATTLTVGASITISGTLGGTGTITGYSNPTTYYIIATNGSTTFTLSASIGGVAITTTAGTPTGLTYTLGNVALTTTAGTPTGLTYTIPSYVQMNVTSTTYGLTYKIVMRRVFPGVAV